MVLLERAMMELSSLTASVTLSALSEAVAKLAYLSITYMREFGFFFFLRMAVAVSSTCGGLASLISDMRAVISTSLCSAPDGSLRLLAINPKVTGMVRQLRTCSGPAWASSGGGLVQPTFLEGEFAQQHWQLGLKAGWVQLQQTRGREVVWGEMGEDGGRRRRRRGLSMSYTSAVMLVSS